VIEFLYSINTSTRTEQGASSTASLNALPDTFHSLTPLPSIPPLPALVALPSIEQTYHRIKPTAPPPEAIVQEVESFFKDYFLAIDESMSQDNAGIKARQLRINGYALYILPSDSFKDAFGPEGRGIFEILVAGKHCYES